MPLFLADLYKVSYGEGLTPQGQPCSLQVFTGPTEKGTKILTAVYRINGAPYQVFAKVVKDYDKELEKARKSNAMKDWIDYDCGTLDNIGQKEEALQVRGLLIEDEELYDGFTNMIEKVEEELLNDSKKNDLEGNTV